MTTKKFIVGLFLAIMIPILLPKNDIGAAVMVFLSSVGLIYILASKAANLR